MKNAICCFAGHSELFNDDAIYAKLAEAIENLIKNYNVKEFWVGNYGDFDHMSAKVVRELKTTYKNIELNLVIPYLTKTINEYKQLYYNNFDNILIADIPQNTPHKYKILKCNQYIVNNSDFMICYIDHLWGGAAKTLKYAQSQKNMKIFNLSEFNCIY